MTATDEMARFVTPDAGGVHALHHHWALLVSAHRNAAAQALKPELEAFALVGASDAGSRAQSMAQRRYGLDGASEHLLWRRALLPTIVDASSDLPDQRRALTRMVGGPRLPHRVNVIHPPMMRSTSAAGRQK